MQFFVLLSSSHHFNFTLLHFSKEEEKKIKKKEEEKSSYSLIVTAALIYYSHYPWSAKIREVLPFSSSIWFLLQCVSPIYFFFFNFHFSLFYLSLICQDRQGRKKKKERKLRKSKRRKKGRKEQDVIYCFPFSDTQRSVCPSLKQPAALIPYPKEYGDRGNLLISFYLIHPLTWFFVVVITVVCY